MKIGDLVMEETSGLIGIVIEGGVSTVKVQFNEVSHPDPFEDLVRWVCVEFLSVLA